MKPTRAVLERRVVAAKRRIARVITALPDGLYHGYTRDLVEMAKRRHTHSRAVDYRALEAVDLAVMRYDDAVLAAQGKPRVKKR